tara:strand:- start:858 stop:1505 length:648 start_codon:yes stop_codon:yes gene_type:complete
MKNELLKRIISSILIIPIIIFFVIKGSILFTFFILACFLIASYEWHMISRKKKYYFFGFIFLILSFLSAFFLRINEFNNIHEFILVILICVATDVGGFVFGKTFKGPKLTKISPNKTYSGMLGSYLLSIISVLVYVNYYSNYWCQPFCPSEIKLLLITILISSISQIGDLIISYFKRKSNIKNTGKLIPGHGGLLDRIDGMIFAVPFAFILFKII